MSKNIEIDDINEKQIAKGTKKAVKCRINSFKTIERSLQCLSGNQLKLIALVAMTCDHVGKEIFPQFLFLQIIGRLAFPIFAYMIAEGCKYTRNRKKYLLTIAAVGLLCQVVYYLALRSMYQNVFMTFVLAIILIYSIDYAKCKKTRKNWLLAGICFLSVFFVSFCLPQIIKHTDFYIDYGLFGVLLPAAIYFSNTKREKLIATIPVLLVLCTDMGGIQWFSFASLILLGLYSEKRGKANLKYLFYVYYPIHLVCIYGLYQMIPYMG